MTRTKRWTLEKVLPYLLLVGSIVGLLVAFALTYDKIQVLKDSHYRPSCNINPILSCGSVMAKPQASLLGVPNTIYGLMGFSVLITLAVLLIAKVQLPKRIWQGIELGLLGGMVFTIYLFTQGVFVINAICPLCFLVWLSMPPMFWYATVYNVREGHLPAAKGVRKLLDRHQHDVIIAWYVIFFGILLQHFWYYWSTLI